MHLARKKVLLGLIDEVDPPHVTDIFPKDGFHEDLTDLPHVNFGTLWKYMIESSNAKKQLSTAITCEQHILRLTEITFSQRAFGMDFLYNFFGRNTL